ncbi:VOC family protein [Nocardia otitidiscaviarum]|uniref:VOC family protein n=2 Tax=Nocardia otitidiscaviarum TaxID=1823 RepID=UPI002457C2C1|nr:VOC family protein [Nocardia otitidiscaviarum]
MTPVLAGVHHLKLPVSDLHRSIEWYRTRLGYEVGIEFHEHGTLMGVALHHPTGGPLFGLRYDPEKAAAAAGFDYFAIAVPDRMALETLAAHLDALGDSHAGVHFASIGWILPELHDPDGHEIRFYTVAAHTELADEPLVVSDARETAAGRDRELAGTD